VRNKYISFAALQKRSLFDLQLIMLCLAAAKADIGVVRRLINARYNLEEKDPLNRYTALHLAAYQGHLKVVKELLRGGANLTALDNYGRTPMDLAIECRHQAIVVALVAETKSRAALYAATYNGDESTVKWLCDRGNARLECTDEHGYTALIVACFRGHVSVVKVLLIAGADTGARGFCGISALSCAAHQGHIAVVEALLWTLPRYNRATPLKDAGAALYLASKSGFKDVVNLLLEEDANMEFTDKGTGNTALLVAAQEGHSAVVSLLLYMGADSDIRNKAGFSALDLAIGGGHKSVVCALRTPPINWQYAPNVKTSVSGACLSLTRYAFT
jgi:ankyrin repeat protein